MTPKKLKIYQLESNALCAPYRLLYPGDALNRLSDVDVTLLPDFGQRQCDEVLREADVFVIQRMPLVPHLAELIEELNRRGIIVVYEIDDDLLHLEPTSRQASINPPDFAAQIERCIRACQCVQCATEPLAASLAGIHPEVVVLENQLENLPPVVDKRGEGGATIVGYAAGLDHGHDWPVVRDAYNRTLAALAQRGIVVETWIIGDREIYESVGSSRKRLLPPLPRDDYMKFLGTVDISIMPLKDCIFNRSKSDVKFLESAAVGTPVVASDLVYGRTISHGETGFVFQNAEEFASQLTQLIVDRPLARRMADAARRYVEATRLIDQHVERWASVYRNWYRRRNELLGRACAQTPAL